MHKDSSTARTVSFDKQDDSIPTVSVMQNPSQIKVPHVPLIHSVMLCTNTTSSVPLTINSIEHSPTIIDAEEWRRAFPEPDLASFDNSFYVTVAIQAMSIEDIDTAFPSMTTRTYSNQQQSVKQRQKSSIVNL